MNKARLEALSDGVFAIVMTLLIFDVRLPTVTGPITNVQLWHMLGTLSPLFVSYALSFLVLSVFWINHHFFFHSYVKTVDRYLNLMNMVYLLFLVFVPFSALLFGTYPYNEPAALVYGLNILAVVSTFTVMVWHVRLNDGMSDKVSTRQIKQARVRSGLTIVSYVLGIIASFVYIPASIFLYLFPMIFNIIPGTLNFAEKIFGFELT